MFDGKVEDRKRDSKRTHITKGYLIPVSVLIEVHDDVTTCISTKLGLSDSTVETHRNKIKNWKNIFFSKIKSVVLLRFDGQLNRLIWSPAFYVELIFST
jgi:hypothetical protein